MQDHLTERAMAELLRQHLEKIGMSHAALCREVGVSQKHMSLVLSGQVAARPAALDYWAWTLGVRFEVKLKKL